jgi:hypothetical protein
MQEPNRVEHLSSATLYGKLLQMLDQTRKGKHSSLFWLFISDKESLVLLTTAVNI